MTYKKGSSDPCKQEACDIQACLKRNHYQEAKCVEEIGKLKDCCRALFESGKSVQSDCCSGFVKELELERQRKARK